jgi:hypothetical protein
VATTGEGVSDGAALGATDGAVVDEAAHPESRKVSPATRRAHNLGDLE